MSVISTSGLTLGYFTLPLASAAGLPGSCLIRNADWSGRTFPSDTVFASSVRSSAEENVGTLRRYGSPPAVWAVDSALAIFSEITRIRPACARRPEVAMLIERAKSAPSFAMMPFSRFYPACCLNRISSLTLADRGLQKMQALAVERGDGRIVHLVGRDLEHLVFQTDGIAGRPGLETAVAILREVLSATRGSNMRRGGTRQRQRPRRLRAGAGLVEFRLDQIARLEVRRVRV